MGKQQPPNAQDALAAAGLLWLGLSQQFVADKLGVSRQTIIRWTKAEWWPDVAKRAETAHLGRMAGTARRVLKATMEGALAPDAPVAARKLGFEAAKFLLERQDPNFQEPDKRVTVDHQHGLARNLAELSVAELRALANRQGPLQLPTGSVEVVEPSLDVDDQLDAVDEYYEDHEPMEPPPLPPPPPLRPSLPAGAEKDDGTLYVELPDEPDPP